MSNPAYAFNDITNPEEYAEDPYMHQLIASYREKITSVLQTELNRKEQIKSALVVLFKYFKKEDDKNTKEIIYTFTEKHHRGEMRPILLENDITEHITSSGSEIDKKIDEYLHNGSNWQLIRIDKVFIEAYTFRRATGGSFIPTPKKLANTKSIINPDNS